MLLNKYQEKTEGTIKDGQSRETLRMDNPEKQAALCTQDTR
jgi:hypothetical protein